MESLNNSHSCYPRKVAVVQRFSPNVFVLLHKYVAGVWNYLLTELSLYCIFIVKVNTGINIYERLKIHFNFFCRSWMILLKRLPTRLFLFPAMYGRTATSLYLQQTWYFLKPRSFWKPLCFWCQFCLLWTWSIRSKLKGH